MERPGRPAGGEGEGESVVDKCVFPLRLCQSPGLYFRVKIPRLRLPYLFLNRGGEPPLLLKRRRRPPDVLYFLKLFEFPAFELLHHLMPGKDTFRTSTFRSTSESKKGPHFPVPIKIPLYCR